MIGEVHHWEGFMLGMAIAAAGIPATFSLVFRLIEGRWPWTR